MNEELLNDTQEEQRVEQEVNIEEIVASLKQQGLGNDEILNALSEMLKEGKITEEDFQKAKDMLEGEERETASDLFGVDIRKEQI